MTWTTWISLDESTKSLLLWIIYVWSILSSLIGFFAYYNTYISFNDYSYPTCEFMWTKQYNGMGMDGIEVVFLHDISYLLSLAVAYVPCPFKRVPIVPKRGCCCVACFRVDSSIFFGIFGWPNRWLSKWSKDNPLPAVCINDASVPCTTRWSLFCVEPYSYIEPEQPSMVEAENMEGWQMIFLPSTIRWF